ncbi:MAG: hypothetical protein J6O61_09035 [Butyrivibrio sp.]|uniref:hypothetical protein n=1 Tax=Butyrivibrio sp. TaxID=28121 RepID=UPI001B1C7CE9|nr:hypothetical protein [Butyrivibrio sp.]MBO6240954.1 hypothetical protein [Butyrivibrio sp.]
MIGLKKYLIAEEKRLKTIKQGVDKRLVEVPEGNLRITSSGKHIQYMHCKEKDGKYQKQGEYLKKEDMPLVRRLAQKSYDQKMKKLVDRRLKQIQIISKEYSEDELELIYTNMNVNRQALVTPVEKTWVQKVADWKAIPYTGKEFEEGAPEIYTKKGERVRSKSEKLIADTLFDLGIEYKYECPIVLKGYGVVYPDFTILSRKTGKEVYWEHDGKMDDPKYSEKAVRKINSYIYNGIIPGDRLMLTFETSNIVLNDRTIKKMIDNFLL